MIDQDLLPHLTETYLTSLVVEVSGSARPDIDPLAPFGELGVDSFYVLKILTRLEADFGRLPKSLLFEHFNIRDLAKYLVGKHAPILAAKFVGRVDSAVAKTPSPAPAESAIISAAPAVALAAPIRMLERDAFADPALRGVLQPLLDRYKVEGSVSLGTRRIAPNLFLGSARRGYLNYGRSGDIILAYGYTGPREYVPEVLAELREYCDVNQLQLNFLADEIVPAIGGAAFSATPFGVLQRVLNLQRFTLDGGAMRRLRYQVTKFASGGTARTEEYHCGSDPATNRRIADIIDRWCATKTKVNPLVSDVRREILAGTLPRVHRLFLTYLDEDLQNVIVITGLCEEVNGYLMDLEFYPPEMRMGGLEFGIVRVIERLVAEGCNMLSLGGTYGCKLEHAASADPEIDRILDTLRAQQIFNDQGNLQFKNKFRPENTTIYLCRPLGSGNPDNVIDIIMMIADPDRMQTPDAALHPTTVAAATGPETDLARILSRHGFNPLNVPDAHVEIDFKTDSWAQLETAAIQRHMRHLRARLQQPVAMDESVRAMFPFKHVTLTESGQAAEHLFFKAWPNPRLVPQNLLFPSTIFHQIDNGFTPTELPHPAIFQPRSSEVFKGDLDGAALESLLAEQGAAVSCVCLELNDNAAGGYPVSMRQLRHLKTLLAARAVPLVLDVTRIVENAQWLIEQDADYASSSLWPVMREILACADAVIGSLTKDFCVNRGGIIATNDGALFARVQELTQAEGGGIDPIDRKLAALALGDRQQIETRVLRRMEAVRRIWEALQRQQVPVVYPAGSHCVLVDVKQLVEFRDFTHPVASFVAWLYLNSGIRAAAHGVGMQKDTAANHLVRLAVPVGLPREEIDRAIDKLTRCFAERVNIPELALENRTPGPLGHVHANYRVVRYHNPSRPTVSPIAVVPAEPSPSPGDPLPERRRTTDIAIVGMAGRYPKARNPREMWHNLVHGRDCIEELPTDRYERRLCHGSTVRYRGGFIDDIDKFDSLFFNISPREAEMLDPQERLFLEVAWEAIEDAGYYPEILARDDEPRQIGVFVGAVWTMYQMLGVEEKHAGNAIVPNSFLWSIANRVSHWMNLSGPSLTVDTACSSSLSALYLACEAMHAGECSSAIVGGVNLDLHQAKFDINRTGGALSPDGVCRSFGKGANGYVMGEGVGALFLKPLARAEQDRDHIYGVIKSAALNHGGRTSGYTVPSPKAQAHLITSALRKAGIGARSIGYVEAHGTGTELGDPIEIAGLNDAFSAEQAPRHTCAVGSIKSNIGHLEAAAGIVGVSKVLLQMQHRQLVPSLHSTELNEFVELDQSPFYVVQRVEPWQPKQLGEQRYPLRAGVSSFGAGGANAHIILEAYERIDEAAPAADELIFPLSARTEEQLREVARRLATFLRQEPVALRDVAHTLQRGRKPFEHRLAITARTHETLLDTLTAFLTGHVGENAALGHVTSADGMTRLLNRSEQEEFVRLLSRRPEPPKMARLWAEGLLPDWHTLQADVNARRIPVPTYPFADKRHWAFTTSAPRRALQAAACIHPMIDGNESTFDRQVFKKVFHQRDFFLADHLVADIPTLPGVAYLELARKAGELAAGRPVRRIRNVMWVSPIAVPNGTAKEVFIELKPSDATVRFEVFSQEAKGRVLHAQGVLQYSAQGDEEAAAEYLDLEAIRRRCATAIDTAGMYPRFKSYGLSLGPSFQVLQEVHKNEHEVLGRLQLPQHRHGDLRDMNLQPSLLDGSLQAGMGAQLADQSGEMFVPFSIKEVEILHPLPATCFSYVTRVNDERQHAGERARTVKTNVVIADETGRVLVRIHESTGVPLREIHKQGTADGASAGSSQLYYAYDWTPAPLQSSETSTPHDAEALVLFDTDERLRNLYQERLRRAGKEAARVVLVRPGERFRVEGPGDYTVNVGVGAEFALLLAHLAGEQCPIHNICVAWGREGDEPNGERAVQEAMARGVESLLLLCQALVAHKLDGLVHVVYLASGRTGEERPHQEAISGFLNTMRLEHPRLIAKMLDVRGQDIDDEQVLDALSAELHARSEDATVVRYDASERWIKKLSTFELDHAMSPASSPTVALRDRGVYLITGGTGGLGRIFATFLATKHRARLVLIGRSALSPELATMLDELRAAGAEILYLAADVSSRDSVSRVIAEAKTRFGDLNGIIHAAGVLRDSLIRHKTLEEMRAVFAPKVSGTLHLDELTRDEPLDFFITFSSLAALTGNGGQSDYAFANAFMDALVAKRERLRAAGQRNGKALSINWALWADGGMKVDAQTEVYFKKTLGMQPLTTATGLDVFVKGLASTRSQFAAVEGVRDKLEWAWGLRQKPAAVPASATPSDGDRAHSARGADETPRDLATWIQNDLSQIVMEFLKLDAADMAVDKILLDLGFDSIGLTTFANIVNEKYQLDLTPVLFFEYPSVAEIASYLARERESDMRHFLQPSATTGADAALPPAATPSTKTGGRETRAGHIHGSLAIRKGWDPTTLDADQMRPSAGKPWSPNRRFAETPIAIVGMSGVMPQSDDLEEFWQHLRDADDLITLIPPDRWRWEDYHGDPLKEANKTNSKWGGFMRAVDAFDARFFGISSREAQMMDPQQRIFLQTVWSAIEDSGQRVSDLSGTRTGLFVGAATNDYVNVMNRLQTTLDAYSAPGNSHSVLANRVSFLLNLRGPSAPIDTACSSSLVALHRAVESMHTGSCDMAIVGGVQAILSPAAYISFGMAGILSNDGRCRTFDKQASGYARGEGCGAIVLKTLAAAEADGNHIYAVIKATAENHGGRVAILTAPNATAQASLLIDAYQKAGVNPATVGYVECHGTGTSLGDPIETQALTKAFAELYKAHEEPPPPRPHCGLSCVKSNIGHLETAAGMASLFKVLLAIKHKQIPATLHFEALNPYIKLEGTPFYVVDRLTPWEAPVDENGMPLPRRAGVSAFGFGGANAHVVLEEYVAPVTPLATSVQGPHIIVLSAKHEERLTAYVRSISAYLETHEVDLAELAYTLQVGRDEMPVRLAFVVSSLGDLKQTFADILEGSTNPPHVHRNRVDGRDPVAQLAIDLAGPDVVRGLVEQRALSRLARLWVSGGIIDWPLLYPSGPPRRISLPTYPFAKERYWIAREDPHATARPIEPLGPRRSDAPPVTALRTEPRETIAAEAGQPTWLFSRDGSADATESRGTAAKIELFLQQEIAIQLQQPLEDVPVDGNLFELGLTSLGVADLVQKTSRLIGEDLSPSALFEYRDIRSVATYLGTTFARSADAIRVTLRPSAAAHEPTAQHHATPSPAPTRPVLPSAAEHVREFPLSIGQKGLYVLQKLHPETSAYNVPLCLAIKSDVDADLLEMAWQCVLRQFPILTARVVEREGALYQRQESACTTSIHRTAIDIVEERELVAFLRRRAKASFDLNLGPLTRIELFARPNRPSILLLTVHHIVFDGVSALIAMRSLLRFYKQLSAGKTVQLSPDLGVYQEFVAWEEAMVGSPEGSAHARYWQRQLGGELPTLELLPDVPPSVPPALAGATLVEALPEDLSARVREFGKAHAVPPSAIFLALFQLLLHRYTQQDDVVVGMPVMGRAAGRFADEVGYFVNMIPLRARFDRQSTLLEFLRKVQGTLLDGLYHSSYPFPLIVDVAKERQQASRPIFQVSYAYQNFAKPGDLSALMDGETLQIEPVAGIWQEGEFDLGLEIFEDRASFLVHAKYNPRVFASSTIERLLNRYVALLGAVQDNPNRCLHEYPLMAAPEGEMRLREFNSTHAAYPSDTCIHDMIAEQVERQGEQTAFACGDAQLTYRELDARSHELALFLQTLGVAPDRLVALCLERSVDLVVAQLAVWRAGGAYVPLDPAYPADRLAFMLHDSEALVVLTDRASAARVGACLGPTGAVPVIVLDDAWKGMRSQEKAAADAVVLRRDVQPHHLAYVIYTSGSTGQPKGVMVEHRHLANLVDWHRTAFGLRASEVTTMLAGLGFDASAWELWPALCAGATVVSPPADVARDPDALLTWWSRQKIDLSFLPTPLAEVALARGLAPERLRLLLVGGDRLRQLPSQPLPFQVVNNYGPTECTVVATSGRVEPAAVLHIGRPIANTQIRILDTDQRPVPIDVAGEMYIGGASVGRGYWRQPELTAERFAPDAFAAQPGARLYRTGDRARWREDGTIEYLGRLDAQVKVRGFRIELGEIEAHLNRHPRIEDSAVLAHGTGIETYLVAYYQALDSTADRVVQIPSPDLRTHLARALPDYMVPATFVSLSALPLTANGKLDRPALARLAVGDGAAEDFEPPRSATEQRLAAIWSKVLKRPVERIGRHDDFFELGGNSLIAVEVMWHIDQSFGRALPLATLFRAPSISSMAAVIASEDYAPHGILVPIQQQGDALPVFGVPGAGGNVLSLQPLSTVLGPRQPLFALQALGLDGCTVPFTSVEQTAEANIAAMKGAQATGPYRLVGVSYGGVVAYEMTRLLLTRGDEVSSLILLDTLAPPIEGSIAVDEPAAIFDACTSMARLHGTTLDIDLARLRRSSSDENMQYVAGLLNAVGLHLSHEQFVRFYRVYRANLLCYRDYAPSPLPRDIEAHLFRATQRREGPPIVSDDYGWNALLHSPIRLHDIDANHFSMLEPAHLAGVATVLTGDAFNAVV